MTNANIPELVMEVKKVWANNSPMYAVKPTTATVNAFKNQQDWAGTLVPKAYTHQPHFMCGLFVPEEVDSPGTFYIHCCNAQGHVLDIDLLGNIDPVNRYCQLNKACIKFDIYLTDTGLYAAHPTLVSEPHWKAMWVFMQQSWQNLKDLRKQDKAAQEAWEHAGVVELWTLEEQA